MDLGSLGEFRYLLQSHLLHCCCFELSSPLLSPVPACRCSSVFLVVLRCIRIQIALSPNNLRTYLLLLLIICSQSLKAMTQSDNSAEDVFHIRKLEISDSEKGFIELLKQLTVCDSVSDEKFKERFEEIAKYGDDHCICVIEDVRSGKIVATGSLFIEKKFVRNCGKAGHIEDVVVDSSARGMQLGKRIVEYLADHAHSMGCYKVILDCTEENRPFYEKCGFKKKEIQMVKYFV